MGGCRSVHGQRIRMGQIVAHQEALAEMRESIRFYESKSFGLGRRFFDEVGEFVRLIQTNPARFAERIPGVRRVNLKRFPYHIHFMEKDDTLWIVSISHDRRKPFYWKDRLTSGGSANWNPLQS
jgi:hypothetical protein